MRKCFLTLPFFLTLLACGTEGSYSETSAIQGPHYLALGDSISFGYTPLVELNTDNVAAGLFGAYPEVLGTKLGYQVNNPSCPGETSGSLIDLTSKDNGCHSGDNPRNQYRKVAYDVSQLDYAVEFLRANEDTKLVTIGIGGNDLLLAEDECATELIPFICQATRVPGLVISFGKNIVHIVKQVRAAGFEGEIIFVTNYARDYKNAVQKLALGLLNAEAKAIGHFNGFKVASGFEAFEKASKDFDGDVCKAGLSIPLPEGGCNQHPSAKGHELLAQTVLDALR